MRVLVFSTHYPNGVEAQRGLQVQKRVAAVARCDIDVRVVAPVGRDIWPPARWQHHPVPQRERLAGFRVSHPNFWATGWHLLDAWNLERAARSHVRQLRNRFDFDLVDAHGLYPDGVVAGRIAQRLRVPCIVTARGSDLEAPQRNASIRKRIVAATQSVQAVIALSASGAETLFRLGVDRHKIHVIPNGLDEKRFRFGHPLGARETLGIFSDENLLLSVGDLERDRGHAVLLDAVARLRDQGLRTSLHVFGEGTERARLEARVARLGLDHQVKFHGTLPHGRLALWYQAASLLVLASRRDVWSQVLSEALACGLPVVSTAVGGVPELVTSGDNGILIDDPSCDAVTVAIHEGLSRFWNRNAIAARASVRNWSDVADQIVRVFESSSGTRVIREPQYSAQPA